MESKNTNIGTRSNPIRLKDYVPMINERALQKRAAYWTKYIKAKYNPKKIHTNENRTNTQKYL